MFYLWMDPFINWCIHIGKDVTCQKQWLLLPFSLWKVTRNLSRTDIKVRYFSMPEKYRTSSWNPELIWGGFFTMHLKLGLFVSCGHYHNEIIMQSIMWIIIIMQSCDLPASLFTGKFPNLLQSTMLNTIINWLLITRRSVHQSGKRHSKTKLYPTLLLNFLWITWNVM